MPIPIPATGSGGSAVSCTPAWLLNPFANGVSA
jgi:hypothetical protein